MKIVSSLALLLLAIKSRNLKPAVKSQKSTRTKRS